MYLVAVLQTVDAGIGKDVEDTGAFIRAFTGDDRYWK